LINSLSNIGYFCLSDNYIGILLFISYKLNLENVKDNCDGIQDTLNCTQTESNLDPHQ